MLLWVPWALLALLLPTLLAPGEARHGGGLPAQNSSRPALLRLSDHLLADYKKGVRPVRDWRKPTTVSIDVIVYAILNVDEKNQVLTTYIWYRQFWADEFLQWNPEDFDNITKLSIPTDSIWVPDILINEFVDVGKSPYIPYVYVRHDGEVQNYKPLQVVTACSLDIYNFPFDVQNCSLTFTSWLHTIQDINISLLRLPETVKSDRSVFMNQGEWELLGVLTQFQEFSIESSHHYAEMKFYVVIRRRPLFYAVSLLLPSIFLMVMDIVGFYLPPDSGERVSFKITLLLGYSVFLIIVSDTLPATAIGTPLIGKTLSWGRARCGRGTGPPLPLPPVCVPHSHPAPGCTGVYFIVCMALLVISLAETILIVRLVHKQDLQRPVPAWLRHLVLERIALLLCLGEQSASRRPPATSQAAKMDDCSDMGNHCSHLAGPQDLEKTPRGRGSPPPPPREASLAMRGLLQELTSIRHFLEKRDESREVARDWLRVGSLLDRLLFRIYLLAVLAYSVTLVTLWSIWQYS
ncbi:5-hydroxytryptamine receptor 3A isoform X1 [Camelus ferus]|uniref:5-hydroxytryptamine receptor 3A isoform X1 n=2 Tax=Camelus TaxID=9836 RepID=A0A8B6YDZ0_CAMFR|nr:5-hydroxytryptamine receptor 3A isoform X1 [Camelus ferus]XP_010951828.1 5-hydroxytryptamine receptor 3A isoform X1 [Camelus bactrianus]